MPRRLPLLLAIALLASAATARTRAVSHPAARPEAATVTGVITSVDGSTVGIAGGLVTIDVSEARIVGELEAGRMLFATVRANPDPAAPLQATMVATTPLADAGFFGTLDSVDTNAGTIAILGRVVHLGPDTSFGGVGDMLELVPGQLAHVQAEAVNGRLVATSVTVLAPAAPTVRTLHGTVRSIGSEVWVIDDTAVQIDARTRIAGSPKIGDTVDVLYRVDNSHANVALLIVKTERPEVPELTRINGSVLTITPSSWVVIRNDGTDVRVAIEHRTIVQPGIDTGDRVEILAQRREDGTYTALLIAKR